MRLQPEKLTPALRTGTKRARVATVLACSIASGDGFSLLEVDAIKKQESVVPPRQFLDRDDYEPSHRKYMLQCARHNEWIEGERDELRSINKCAVWTKEDPPPRTKVIPLKWVYKVTKKPDGTIARYKCRLVAQGIYQVFGEDYFQTYSPVAKLTSIRTVLALSAQLGLNVHQIDVDTAFLNADISENIWVQFPKGTPVPDDEDGVYKLKKSLNGHKQAPREWSYLVNNFLISIKFERMEADPCIYKKTERVKVDGKEQIRHSIVAL
jgi:Reverse transcriptase (RNA-dependent DNA polymerase)